MNMPQKVRYYLGHFLCKKALFFYIEHFSLTNKKSPEAMPLDFFEIIRFCYYFTENLNVVFVL